MTARSTPPLPFGREDGGQGFGPVLLLLASLFPALSADAAVLRVNPDGSGDYPTIQAAIDAAAPYDTVALGSGLFTGPGQVDLYSDKVLTLRSIEGDPGTCILDGAGFSSALTAELGATVEAITFRRFQPGLTLWGASTLSDCVFREGGTMVEASWDVVMNRSTDRSRAWAGFLRSRSPSITVS